jgi:uncharacterized membrane protein
MDVNELARRQIAAIDAKIHKLRSRRPSQNTEDDTDRRKLKELEAARRMREKLILVGPRGAALVA